MPEKPDIGTGPRRRRGGRPARQHEPGERVPMSFRVPPELKRRMDDAATESGRSVAQEVEMRLNQSFAIDDHLDRIEAKLDKLLGER